MNPREARQHRGLGQIVFLYFVQKKGWLGVVKGQGWGTGPHDFLRRLANQSALSRKSDTPNFFNDILEPLFYNTPAKPKSTPAIKRLPLASGDTFARRLISACKCHLLDTWGDSKSANLVVDSRCGTR